MSRYTGPTRNVERQASTRARAHMLSVRSIPTVAEAQGLPSAGIAVSSVGAAAALGLKPAARPHMDAFLARLDIGLEGLAERSRPEHARQFASVQDLERSDVPGVHPQMLKHRGQRVENYVFSDRIFCIRTRLRRGRYQYQYQVQYAVDGRTVEIGPVLHDHQQARALAAETARQLEADDVEPADLSTFDEPVRSTG